MRKFVVKKSPQIYLASAMALDALLSTCLEAKDDAADLDAEDGATGEDTPLPPAPADPEGK